MKIILRIMDHPTYTSTECHLLGSNYNAK